MGGCATTGALAGVCALLALAGPASADGDADADGFTVRVLLREDRGPVRIEEGAGHPTTTVAAVRGGLEADTAPVGPVWRAPPGAVVRVGEIRVRGDLEVRRVPEGVAIVAAIPLEEYVAEVVSREVYDGWDPEILKAQAVVARTYALHERERAVEIWDVRSGTGSQVFGGLDAETPASRAAVAATRGEILTWQGRPILAAYHSASGGRTASAEEVWGQPLPYLISQPVENEEESPDTYWRARVAGTTLGRALAPLGVDVGSVREAEVVSRSASGRAAQVRVRGDKRSTVVEARALRDAVGPSVVRSTLFEIRRSGGDFVFVGSGHGHGVGMSQWAAQAMAARGAGYREILEKFYPGTELARWTGR